MTLLEWIGAIATTGGGLTAVATVARRAMRERGRRAEAAAAVRRTETIHDERVSQRLLQRLEEQDERIDNLRERLDEKDEQIGELARETAECHRSRDECRRETADLRTTIGELREALERRDEDVTVRVQRAVREEVHRTPTPPGVWRADLDEEGGNLPSS